MITITRAGQLKPHMDGFIIQSLRDTYDHTLVNGHIRYCDGVWYLCHDWNVFHGCGVPSDRNRFGHHYSWSFSDGDFVFKTYIRSMVLSQPLCPKEAL